MTPRRTAMPRLAPHACLAVLLVAAPAARPPLGAQHPTFTPDRADGIYAAGEKVGWTATLPRGARPVATYRWIVRRDGGDSISSGTLAFRNGRARLETSFAEPAMLLVEVTPAVRDTTFGDRSTGGPGRVRLGAAVAPTRIAAAEPKPDDFDAFWAAQLARLKAVPLEPVVKTGESGVAGIEWGTFRVNNVEGARVYGHWAKPAREGKFPALVMYHWASPPYPLQKGWITGHAQAGWLVLGVEPHDVPADMPQAFYDALPALVRNYHLVGQHDREESYFLRMYLGTHRALEYLKTRPDWDGRTIVVTGTSMGGQQGFVAAALDTSVTGLVVNVPAGADVTASLHGRSPSYPNWNVANPAVRQAARYFDPASFAPRITARSMVAAGFIDDVSTPTGIWAVFNGIRGPKELVPMAAPHNHLATPRQLEPWERRSRHWLDALREGRDPMATSLAP